MIKINYKESILKHIKDIEHEVEYKSIIKAINNLQEKLNDQILKLVSVKGVNNE